MAAAPTRPPTRATPDPAAPTAAGQLALGPETMAMLRAALAEVPARLAAGDHIAFRDYAGPAVAGKTGTAETGVAGVTQAWFAAYAPAARPRLALAVLVERGGEGATVAAPVARLIVEGAYAAGGRGTKSEDQPVN